MERDVYLNITGETDVNFNSHAHVERDRSHGRKAGGTSISTHTLTWSVTLCEDRGAMTIHISTHTLTWSVTNMALLNSHLASHFNSHAHVERDNYTQTRFAVGN